MPSDTIFMHEELRAGMLDADNICSICRGEVWTQCSTCGHDFCQACTVKCAGCGDDNEYCLSCAIRNGYVETAGKHYCEDCFCESVGAEPDMEFLRR